LLLLILVGIEPFNARTAADFAARDAATAGGDLVRQAAFLGVFALIAYAAARTRGVLMVAAIPAALALLLLWCLLSALWGGEPEVIARRAVLAAVFVASMMLSVDTLGAERAAALWRTVMGAVIVVDIASSLVIHQAVHQADDVESGIAGAWRGLHAHKNAAGPIAATAAAMFFYFALETRRRADILLCLAALFFLVMTRSKSSLGLLPVALAAGGLYRIAWRSTLDRVIAAIAAALALIAVAVAASVEWEAISRILDDPQNFTGRAAIWQAELAYIRDHPLLGAGFGTFGNTGMRSPIYAYVGAGWVSQIGEGHNGYLEMLVTIGGVGFVLGLAAIVVQPFVQFWNPRRGDANFDALLFTLFLFALLHNFMESDFIVVTGAQWGQILLVLALLRVSGRAAAERP
ncbi:MAG TPA: O-antigen ligase family protein, partial [Rhizomicrobium sp.]